MAVVAAVDSVEWDSTSGALKSISVGQAGVWGANKRDRVHYRQGTYGDPTSIGSDWIETDGGFFCIGGCQRELQWEGAGGGWGRGGTRGGGGGAA